MTGPLHSLQGRLLLLLLAVVLAVWAAMAALTWIDTRRELDALLDSHLAQAAALLIAQQSAELEEEHSIDAPALHRYAPTVAFQVFHEGRLVLRSANAPAAPMMDAGADSGAGFATGFATVRMQGAAWRVFAAHGAEQDVQVYVGEQMASRQAILKAVLFNTVRPMAIVLPLLALAAWWAVHRGLAPLRRLGRALAERQPQALQPVELGCTVAEITPVVGALNSLFARIGTLLDAERRFTADAAHELRTPIAAIRAQAQVALAETDDTLRRHALHGTLEGCDRATRLVEQLLTLSRLEAGELPPMAAVDLAALVQRVLASLAARAVAKEQTLDFDASGACTVHGNEPLLEVLVRNLADNAVRYSPRGAQIRVLVQQARGAVALTVADNGPGMTATERQRLGERFFRLPGSAESGSGLGWSIVRRIAAVHRLELQVDDAGPAGGLLVRVLWRTPAP